MPGFSPLRGKRFFALASRLKYPGGWVLTHASGHLAGLFDNRISENPDGSLTSVNINAGGDRVASGIAKFEKIK